MGQEEKAPARAAAVVAALHAFRRTFAELQRLLAAPGRGIPLSDMLVLHQIAHGAGLTPGQVAAMTGLTSGGVTAVLDRLETKGLVIRMRSATDRRSVVVALAPGAHESMRGIMTEVHAQAEMLFDGWATSRIHELVELLAGLQTGEGSAQLPTAAAT